MEGVDPVQFHEPMNETEAISEVIFHCHICMEAFVCEDLFRIHMDNHSSEMPFVCKVCDVRFIDEVHLNKHTDMKHAKDDAYEACSVCGKLFHDKMNLKNHMAVHSEERPFSCAICGRSFKRKGELETHFAIHTGVKPYKCKICHKSYTQKYTLKTHMRTHTGEKPFKCSICSKEFNRSSGVMLHMRQHTGEKPYNCTVCKEAFKFGGDLKKHLAKVHNIEDEKLKIRILPMKRGKRTKKTVKNIPETNDSYECAVCQKEFNSLTSFNEHIKVHDDNNSCYLCGQKLKTKGDKRRHVTQPIEIKESECYTCGVSFSELQDFRQHMSGHSELCRLEECLKNAENIQWSSNKAQVDTVAKCNSEEEDGNLEEYNDLDGNTEAIDNHSSPTSTCNSLDVTKYMPVDMLSVKQEQENFDEEPEMTILELAEREEGLKFKSQNVMTASVTNLSKKELNNSSLDVTPLSTVTVSDPDQNPKPRRRSPYKVARVSPPRTRGSLRVRFKESSKKEESSEEHVTAVSKNVKKQLSPCRENSNTDGEDSDDSDLAETYSIYVKNILRLQPLDKQMALIKAINTTIGKFIND